MNYEQLRDLYIADLSTISEWGQRVRKINNWTSIRSTLRETIEPMTFPLADNDERDVWLWSDLHFGHKNIIRFSNRPYGTVEEMNEHLILNHNDYVKENDICIWVGDVAFGGDEFANRMLNQCNGYKILIIGNHDFNKQKLRKMHFNETHLCGIIEAPEVDLILTHYPMFNLPLPYVNIHGHIHAGGTSNVPIGSLQHINVNCEFIGYKPIHLNEIIRAATNLKTQMEY